MLHDTYTNCDATTPYLNQIYNAVITILLLVGTCIGDKCLNILNSSIKYNKFTLETHKRCQM